MIQLKALGGKNSTHNASAVSLLESREQLYIKAITIKAHRDGERYPQFKKCKHLNVLRFLCLIQESNYNKYAVAAPLAPAALPAVAVAVAVLIVDVT